MIKLAIAGLMGLVFLFANAQPVTVEKKVTCDKLKIIVEVISSEYNEVPTWVGKDDTSKYVLMSNAKTGTWTLIQYNDTIACVLGAGDKSKPLMTGPYV